MHLAERAAEDREVLAVDRDLAAVDGAVAGDHAVAVRAVLLEAEVLAAVTREAVELHERALVQQRVDALASGLLSARVLLVLRGGLGGRDGGLDMLAKLLEGGCGGLARFGHVTPFVAGR